MPLLKGHTSGPAISYTSSNASIARIVNDNQVELLKDGTVTITASQNGNGNYTAAIPVSQQLTINDNSILVIVSQSTVRPDTDSFFYNLRQF